MLILVANNAAINYAYRAKGPLSCFDVGVHVLGCPGLGGDTSAVQWWTLIFEENNNLILGN